jgi:hypothetical protein
MRVLMKYIFWLLSLFFLTIYYLLGTTLGHLNIRCLVENHYSKKLENKLEVLSLNLEGYPYIIAELRINDGALLSLEGDTDKEDMNLSYHLRGESFQWDTYAISNPIDLKGKLEGKSSELLVKGEGEILDGEIRYSFIRKSSRIEALEVMLDDISSEKLVKFLEYDFEVEGDIDLFMDFEYYSSFRKKGLSKITMKKAVMPKVSEEVEFSLDGEVIYKDLLREFFLDIHSDIGKLRIANGYYNKSADLMKAEYGLHINELSYFEKLLGHKYQGQLNTAGKVKYEAEKLSLLGDSKSFGGLLDYDYKNNYLELEFKGVSLEKLLRQLSFPALLSSKIYGTASYDIEDEIILLNTKLKETRFRRTKMTDKIYEVTDIDIRKDVYNNSTFTAAYQNSILTSFLQIDNGVNHLYLKDTRMNSKTNEITANFEVAIEGQEFLGEVYGTLEDPKVSLDMSKLIKYQINKKIENFFGRRKVLPKNNIKNEVDDIELKVIKYKTRAFLDGFFN